MSPRPLSKRDPAVAEILRGWRRLTGGRRVQDPDRRTIVACSGGPDSVALALALHAASGLHALAHIVHDLRPPPEARADADFVRDLAGSLGVAYLEDAVQVPRGAGGIESSARRLRYAALDRLSARSGCGIIATGHHADDQLETLIMRLARGAGPAGLRGILPRRRLSDQTLLIRPALAVPRTELARLCTHASVVPRTDATNSSTTFTRNAVRHTVIPALSALFPNLAARSNELAHRMRVIDEALNHQADALAAAATLRTDATSVELDRSLLRAAPPMATLTVLRTWIVGDDRAGADQASWRPCVKLLQAVRDNTGGKRQFQIGRAVVVVTALTVAIRRESGQ